MVFNCLKCSKGFSTKWNLKRHGERKTQCGVAETSDARHAILNSMPRPQNSMPDQQTSMRELQNSMSSSIPNTNNKKNIIKPINLYICVCCNKSYSNKTSKYKHQIKCKNSNKSINKEENVENIKEIIKKIKNTDKTLIIKKI